MLAIPILTLDAGLTPKASVPEAPGVAASSDDLLSTARRLAATGFSRVHLPDDGPRSVDSGGEGARELLRHAPLHVQAEVRDLDERTLSDLLGLGAQWIVAGLADLEEVARLGELASALPGRLLIDLEPRGHAYRDARRPARVFDLIAALESQDLGGVVVTAPNTGSTPTLTTLTRIEELVVASPWPLQVRCAPDSLQALRNLEDRGVACALFRATGGTESIDPRMVAEEFVA